MSFALVVGACRRRFPGNFWGTLWLVLALALAGCRQSGPSDDYRVELILSSDPLKAATTFELRFEEPMVKSSRTGLSVEDPPLVISPPLKGTFTWLTTHSGIFTPAELLAMDTTYHLTLRSRLLRADGQPLSARLQRSVTTPPFSAVAFSAREKSTNAFSLPEVRIVFNRELRPSQAEPFVYFQSRDRRRVAASLRVAEPDEIWSWSDLGGNSSLQTWEQEWKSHGRTVAEGNERSEGGDGLGVVSPTSSGNSAPAAPAVSHLIVATPREALPVARDWALVLQRGLPSTDPRLRTRERVEAPIGDVTPFTVQCQGARHLINSSPVVSFDFSKAVPDFLTNEVDKWIDVTPPVPGLKAEVASRSLLLRGPFESGRYYSFHIRKGFPAAEPFTLGTAANFTATIPNVNPRLYFPAFARDQLAGGRRSFPLLTVNLPKVRLRAKLLHPESAIYALRNYEATYFRDWRSRRQEGTADEPYRFVDYDLIPGRTIHDEMITADPGVPIPPSTNLSTIPFRGSAAPLPQVYAPSDVPVQIDLSWDKILGEKSNGMVFLQAQSAENNGYGPGLGTEALIQVTDLGLVWKHSTAGMAIFVFSCQTGQPVSGAAARIYNNENIVLGEGITDERGVAHVPWHPDAMWVAAQLGTDFHFLKIHEPMGWLPVGRLPWTWGQPGDARRLMVFSDRSLYRPGETLLLKAIIRDWAESGLTIPNSVTGRLECLDSRGRSFLQTNIAFSALGSWDAAVPLPLTPLGQYSTILRVGPCENYHWFYVQDFRPNAFEIRLDAKSSYSPEEKIELPLSARYYFGKGLSRARVKWNLQAVDTYFRPERFPGYYFGRDDFEARLDRGQSSFAVSGQGMLSLGSNLLISAEIPVNPVAPQPRAVTLLAEVTDVNQQTLTKTAEFLRHSSDFYLGLRATAGIIYAGKSLPLEAAAVGADGFPWIRPVKATLKLARVEWVSTRVQGAGRAVRYHNEPILTNVLQQEIEIQPVLLPERAADEPKGFAIAGIVPAAAGDYLLEVTATDSAGRPVVSSIQFGVAAPEQRLGWDYRNEVQLALKPAQPEYLPGQTAEILVEAPINGTALVTVEREKVLRSFTVKLEGNAPTVRVPILPSDLPNIYVGVTLIRGAEDCPRRIKEPDYRSGYCGLAVVDPATRLTLEVTPAATNCLPGETVEIAVTAKDSAGAAASDCELTLYAVDEGILSIMEHGLPDPHAFFYNPRPLAVQSHISLRNLLPEDPEELRFQNKGYFGGGGGRERIRRKFLACAYWNATLKTDSDGKAVARFSAPDSLTRYRVVAVAHNAVNQFGLGQSAFEVSKPLILEPALPQFASITDHLTARAVIQNQTTQGGDVIVTLDLDDKARTGEPLSRRVAVPGRGFAVAEFPVELVGIGASSWTWKARFADAAAGGFTDAVQSALDVGHVAPVLRQVLLARYSAQGASQSATNLLVDADEQVLSGKGTLTITVANSRISELQPTIDHLLHYPYGCVEQTCSSLLPWILVRENPSLRCMLSSGNNPDDAIRAGIHRLFSMQTESGGLTYWPGAGQPMLWASAYGGMVLALAKHHGASVPQGDFNRLLNYLSGELRSPDYESNLQVRPLALYALALANRSEPAYHERLYSKRHNLSRENRALLALAMLESKGSADLARDLLKPGGSTHSDYENFGGPAREWAVRLLALIQSDPGAVMVDETVTDLMRERRSGHWGTTQGDAWALLALTEYARVVEAATAPIDARLVCGDQSFPFHLDQQTNAITITLPIDPAAPRLISLVSQPSLDPLSNPSAAPSLFTTTVLETRSPSDRHPQEDHGIAIQRTYERLDDENVAREIEGRDLRVGDRVLVTLHLQVRQVASYVAVDDALPSILEAINPEFKTQGSGLPNSPRGNIRRVSSRGSRLLADDAFEVWYADYREIRKDRFLSFANYVEPGNYQIRYIARVRAAGTVTAPSARVEEMYHPDRYGLSETCTLSSKPIESQ